MNILLILANPNPSSFCHAIASTAEETLKKLGYTVVFHDLCSEGFDPLLLVEEIPRDAVLDPVLSAHCSDLLAADGIIVVHPNWWGMPPAILTDWIDRVIRPGVAYRFVEGDSGEGIPVGLLKTRSAMIFNTSNTSPGRETTVFGDPLERIWKDCIFGLCGVTDVTRHIFRTVVTSTPEERNGWLSDVNRIVSERFPPA